jgi:hypothetical protein
LLAWVGPTQGDNGPQRRGLGHVQWKNGGVKDN